MILIYFGGPVGLGALLFAGSKVGLCCVGNDLGLILIRLEGTASVSRIISSRCCFDMLRKNALLSSENYIPSGQNFGSLRIAQF